MVECLLAHSLLCSTATTASAWANHVLKWAMYSSLGLIMIEISSRYLEPELDGCVVDKIMISPVDVSAEVQLMLLCCLYCGGYHCNVPTGPMQCFIRM